jgi:hypothetical protein
MDKFVDQLGRLPLRVFPIGKYAFQKKRICSVQAKTSLSAVLQATLRVLLLYTPLQVLRTAILLLPASHRHASAARANCLRAKVP